MLGKRPRIMRRTSSVSFIESGSVNRDSSPLPERPKEKQKPSSYPSPGSSTCAPRQVIGFHPKVSIDEDLDLSTPISPRPPNGRSPTGSPRSGLGDMFASSRPWERKEGGVGLGIVVSLSGSQEDVVKGRDEVRGCPVPGGSGRKTSPQSHHLPSVFAPSRASPPITIHHSSNARCPCPAHCSHQTCGQAAFGLPPVRPDSALVDRSQRPNSSTPTATWSKPIANGDTSVMTWGHHADMEVDRSDPLLLAASPVVTRLDIATLTTTEFTHNFLDACHLCRRRLGEGRDIYIYRGDRAFCSPECRHQQIVNDERPEKCSSAVMKMGSADVRSTSQRSRVMAAGTAAAA